MSDITKPQRGQKIYRDSELKGFGLRVTPGSMSYIVESRVNGSSRRVTIAKCDKMTPEQARREARRILGEMSQNKLPSAKACFYNSDGIGFQFPKLQKSDRGLRAPSPCTNFCRWQIYSWHLTNNAPCLSASLVQASFYRTWQLSPCANFHWLDSRRCTNRAWVTLSRIPKFAIA